MRGLGARRSLVGLLGGALLLAACGGTDDGGPAAAAADDGTSDGVDGADGTDGDDAASGAATTSSPGADGAAGDGTDDGDGVVAEADVSEGGSEAAEPEGAADGADAANAPILAWEATDLSGTAVAGSDFAGGDVLLWMWAPWCSICNREAPDVANLLGDYEGEVEIVGIAGRDDVDQHVGFVERHGLEGMPTVVDDDGSLWAAYGISYQPAWVFINDDGAAQVVPGALGEERLRELLDALVDA